MRRAARTDANQAHIIRALRACGVAVADLSRLGGGCPDLLCYHHGRWIPIEIKDRTGKLTRDEAVWWTRMGVPPIVARTAEEAINLSGWIR